MFLKHEIEHPYPWMKTANPVEEFISKLSIAEDEEDSELYLFHLYLDSKKDFRIFNTDEEIKVRRLLSLLIEDTQKHTQMIVEVMEELKKLGGQG